MSLSSTDLEYMQQILVEAQSREAGKCMLAGRYTVGMQVGRYFPQGCIQSFHLVPVCEERDGTTGSLRQ